MKKLFVSMFALTMMVTSSALNAQDEAANLEVQAAETVAAAAEKTEEGSAVVEAQEAVSDGVAEVPLPVADVTPVAEGMPVADAMPVVEGMAVEGVIYDAGVFNGGFVAAGGCCEPIQTCGCCCDQTSFVEPVVYNQPIFNQPVFAQSSSSQPIPSSAVSIVNPAPAPAPVSVSVPAPVSSPAPLATFTSAPVTSGCSSCSGGVVDYASAPMATSFESPIVSEGFVSAPVASEGFVSAPAGSVGCSSCGVSAAPVVCDPCQNSRRFRRGIFTRFRNAAITSAINDN